MIIFELKVLHNVLDLENCVKNNIKVLTRYLFQMYRHIKTQLTVFEFSEKEDLQ